VASATRSSPEYQGLITTNAIAPPQTIAPGQTYFWRVDVVSFSRMPHGQVWSFTTAPVLLAPVSLDATVPVDSPDIQRGLTLTSSGAALPWTVTETLPWLTLSSGGGSTPATLGVTMSTAGLGAGTYTGALVFTAGGISFSVPVSMRLYAPEITQMLTDPARPYVYAIHQGSGTTPDSLLLFFNTETEQIEKAIPIGTRPTDMTIIRVKDGSMYPTGSAR